jgi:predicted Zn-dependent peptidase
VEPPQEGEYRVTLRLQSERFVLMGYHKPDGNHPDDAVYQALSGILSEGRSSRLYGSLVRDQKIAVQAFGFPDLPGRKYPGLFAFIAVTAPGHENGEIEKGFDAEIERLKKELVSAEELEGVKRRARAGMINSFGDNLQLANALADWQVLTGDWHNLFAQLDKLEAVTPPISSALHKRHSREQSDHCNHRAPQARREASRKIRRRHDVQNHSHRSIAGLRPVRAGRQARCQLQRDQVPRARHGARARAGTLPVAERNEGASG